jgi:hypothetical protein
MREETMEPRRFSFNARGMIPRWFLVVWDLVTLLIVGVAIAGLRLHPAAIGFLALGRVFMGTTRLIVWTLSNGRRNLVELGGDSLGIQMGHPLLAVRAQIPFSNIERIQENAVHTFWPVWVWPYRPLAPHVDLRLRRRLAIPGVAWRFNVFPFDVADPVGFAAELRRAARAETVS